MIRWEYRRIIASSDINDTIPRDEAEEFLDVYGNLGWELTAMVNSNRGYVTMWFKKESDGRQ